MNTHYKKVFEHFDKKKGIEVENPENGAMIIKSAKTIDDIELITVGGGFIPGTDMKCVSVRPVGGYERTNINGEHAIQYIEEQLLT